MIQFDSPTVLVFAAQLVAIVACTAVIVDLAVRETTVILYPEGVKLLAVSLVTLTAATVLKFAYTAGIVDALFLSVVAEGVYVLAGCAGAFSMWYFSRDFIRTVDRTVASETDADGGFEDA